MKTQMLKNMQKYLAFEAKEKDGDIMVFKMCLFAILQQHLQSYL